MTTDDTEERVVTSDLVRERGRHGRVTLGVELLHGDLAVRVRLVELLHGELRAVERRDHQTRVVTGERAEDRDLATAVTGRGPTVTATGVLATSRDHKGRGERNGTQRPYIASPHGFLTSSRCGRRLTRSDGDSTQTADPPTPQGRPLRNGS
ncbi:hypothetical protein MILUP08_45012 [Micromonospora lupini str. Lupac 08]|uniref:Uncharacterized protein n=1 Tax=Micromonospora lupini str. Lupac 08 TaxID=1150864 RepID=I0L8I6_9ACTN|nr:hypothetical protein MILUP08_45012 [Micromonospora lupini str. Lupac 08]